MNTACPDRSAALRRLLGPAVLGALLAAAVLSLTGAGAAAAAQPAARTGAPVTGSAQSAWARGMWVWNQPTPKNLVAFAQARGITELFVSVPDNLPTSARLTWVQVGEQAGRPRGDPAAGARRRPGLDRRPGRGGRLAGRGAVDRAVLRGARRHRAVAARGLGHRPGPGRRGVPRHATTGCRPPTHAAARGGRRRSGSGPSAPPTAAAVDAAVLARVDKVTVMSYRDTVTGAGQHHRHRRPHPGRRRVTAGKPVRLAVETNNLGQRPGRRRKQTFYGRTEAAVNTALDQVDAAESGVGELRRDGRARLRRLRRPALTRPSAGYAPVWLGTTTASTISADPGDGQHQHVGPPAPHPQHPGAALGEHQPGDRRRAAARRRSS